MPDRQNDPDLFEPRMPEVDFPSDLESIFAKARRVGTGELAPAGSQGRHVAVVTPGRMVMMHPPGTMSRSAVEAVEKLLPSAVKQRFEPTIGTLAGAKTLTYTRNAPISGSFSRYGIQVPGLLTPCQQRG